VRTRRVAQLLITLVVAVLLWGTWPQSLGGSVAYVKVNGESMDGTYNTGDLIVVHREAHYAVGDIIAYRVPKDKFAAGAQVIHRIVGGNGSSGFVTRGDNRTVVDEWHPRIGDVVGTAWARFPGLGSWFSKMARPIPLGALCGGLTVLVMLFPKRKRAGRQPTIAASPREVAP
jgi:signal peptidase